MNKMINNLSEYRSEIMGISILLIALFHFGPISFPGKTFLSFAVDIFIFLSGFGISYSIRKSVNNFNRLLDFYKRRVFRILPASCLAGIVSCEIGIYKATPFLLDCLGLGTWYIRSIIILYILSPLFYFILIKFRVQGFLALLFSILSLFYILKINIHESYEGFSTTTSVLFWTLSRSLSFIFGMAIPLLGSSFNHLSGRFTSGILLVFSVFMLFTSCALKQYYEISLDFDFLYASWFVFSVANIVVCKIFLWGLSQLPRCINGVLNWVGRYSLELYLSHLTVYPLLLRYSKLPIAITFLICLISSLVGAYLLKIAADFVMKIPQNVKNYLSRE